MRGKQRFDAFFAINEPETPTRRGRNSKLIQRRNKCIADRYYYYGHLTQKRFDVIMKLLSREFFLSVDTLPAIIDSCTERLETLKEMKPTVKYFRLQWPFMKW